MGQKTITVAVQREAFHLNNVRSMKERFLSSLDRRCSAFAEVSVKSILNFKHQSNHYYFLFDLAITDVKKFNVAKLKDDINYRTVTKLNNYYQRVEEKLSNPEYKDVSVYL